MTRILKTKITNMSKKPVINLIIGILLLLCTLCAIIAAFTYMDATIANLGFISLSFTFGCLVAYVYIDAYLEATNAK